MEPIYIVEVYMPDEDFVDDIIEHFTSIKGSFLDENPIENTTYVKLRFELPAV